MKRRFLGLPVPVMAIGLAILLVGSGVLAAIIMQKDIESTVRIVGAGAEVYENEACTVELIELDFGAIEKGKTTASIPFWVKNISDEGYGIYLALSQTGLDPMLALYEGEGNLIAGDPMPLIVFSDQISGYWAETATTTRLVDAINDSVCEWYVTPALLDIAGSMVVKIDDELILVENHDGEQWKGITRGYDGTTAASHISASIIILMEWVEEVDEIFYDLLPGEVLPVVVHLEADPDIVRGDYSFILTVHAQDAEF